MISNVWYSIRDDFDFEDEDNQARLQNAHDLGTVSRQYKQERGQGRTFSLVSCWYQYTDEAEVEAAVDDLRSANPGRTRVLGAWYNDTGLPFGTLDGSPPTWPQYGNLERYMPDDPDGTPNPTLRDVNILAGQTFRNLTLVFVRAPTNLTWQPNGTSGMYRLEWDRVPGARYKVYNNGSHIAEVTNTVYVTMMTGDFYVTAIKQGGESAPSNTVTIP